MDVRASTGSSRSSSMRPTVVAAAAAQEICRHERRHTLLNCLDARVDVLQVGPHHLPDEEHVVDQALVRGLEPLADERAGLVVGLPHGRLDGRHLGFDELHVRRQRLHSGQDLEQQRAVVVAAGRRRLHWICFLPPNDCGGMLQHPQSSGGRLRDFKLAGWKAVDLLAIFNIAISSILKSPAALISWARARVGCGAG